MFSSDNIDKLNHKSKIISFFFLGFFLHKYFFIINFQYLIYDNKLLRIFNENTLWKLEEKINYKFLENHYKWLCLFYECTNKNYFHPNICKSKEKFYMEKGKNKINIILILAKKLF